MSRKNEMVKEKKARYTEQAIFITCRSCGCEYLESKEWFSGDNKTECPMCGNILEVK